MRNRWPSRIVLCVVAAALSSPFSLAVDADGSVQAHALRLEGMLEGSTALAFAGWTEGTVPEGVGDLRLEAGWGRLEMDVARIAASVGGVAPLPATPDDRHETLQNFTLQIRSVQPDSRLFLVPSSARLVHDEAGRMDVRPSAGERLLLEPHVSSSRPDAEVPTASSSEVFLDPASGLLTAQGDFMLALWGVNFSVDGAGGPRDHWTGRAASPVVEGLPVEGAEMREAYLQIRGGLLRLPAAAGLRILATGGEVGVGHGSVELDHATGRLDSLGLDLEGERLDLEGGLGVLFSADLGGGLRVSLSGSPSAVTVDGRAVALPGTGPALPWPLAVLGTGGVAGVLAAGQFAVRRSRFQRLEQALAEGDHGTVRRLASRFGSWGPFHQEARLVHALSFVKAGPAVEAVPLLESGRWRRRNRAAREFLLARVRAGQGLRDAALRHLVECLLLQPAYRLDALADEVLAPLAAQALTGAGSPGRVEGYT